MNSPSIPIPETPERRAELSRELSAATGLDDAILERLVRAFYGAAREDAMLGPLFAHVRDWETHIARIRDFWSSVALMSGRYHGQPMAAHAPLPLRPEHFARWLELFEETARAICPPQGVAHLMERARRIASSLQIGLAVQRGELPPRRARRVIKSPEQALETP
jgi:hemoglobin